MSGPRPSRHSLLHSPALWIFVAALAVQLSVVIRFSHTDDFLPKGDDTKFYDDWALRVAGGEWTTGHAFYGLPGYAYAVGMVYKLAGHDPFLIGAIQAVIFALIAVLVWNLGRLAFDDEARKPLVVRRRAGTVIGGMAALGWIFFAPAEVFAALLMPTVLAVLAYWGCIWWLLRAREVTIVRPWLAIGVCVGFTAMFVATVLFLIPLLLAAIFCKVSTGQARSRRALHAGLAAVVLFAGVFTGMAPAWIHNYFVARERVLLSAHGGVNFFLGNNPAANGYPRIPPMFRASQEGLLEDSVRLAEANAGGKLTHTEVSRFWSDRAKAWIRQHPFEWFRLLLTKLANFWNAYSYDDLTKIPLLRADGVLPPALDWGFVAALGLPGLLWTFWRSPKGRWIAAAVCLHICALLPVFITERYRLAAAPGLLLCGAYGLYTLWNALACREWKPVVSWLVLTAAAVVLVTLPRREPGLWSLTPYTIGLRALESAERAADAGDRTAADREFQKAQTNLEIAYAYVPDNAETNFVLGNLWYARGDRVRAKPYYRRTLELNPQHRGALSNVAVLAIEEKNWAFAERLLNAALVLEPDDARGLYLLARVLVESGRLDEARGYLEKALKLQPEQREMIDLQRRISDSSENRR